MECFICKSTSDLVTSFPCVTVQLKKWKELLEITCPDEKLKNKKLCVKHFAPQYHKILLTPGMRRGRFIFPMPVSETNESEIPSNDTFSDICDDNETEKDKEIRVLKQKVFELERENKSLKVKLQNIDTVRYAMEKLNDTRESLTEGAKVLNDLLFVGGKGHKYSESEKSFCKSYYHMYPSAYVYLNKQLGSKLPSRRTMIRWDDFKQLNCGIIKETMSQLKGKVSDLNPADKNLCLILDEMDGKPGLRYCPTRDSVIGYEELNGKSNKLAKKFLAFMVRGLNGVVGNSVISTYATEKGVTGDQLVSLIPFIIKELSAIGYNVCVLNMDQSAVNRKAFAKLGVTVENPFFVVDEQKVFAGHDIPHLFKSVSCIISSLLLLSQFFMSFIFSIFNLLHLIFTYAFKPNNKKSLFIIPSVF